MLVTQADTAGGGGGLPVRGMPNPAAGSKSHWLALGVFYEPAPLWNVFAELAGAGFGVERFCVVRLSSAGRWAAGWPDTVAAVSDTGERARSLHREYERLFSDVREMTGLHHDGTYALSAGALLDAFLKGTPHEADGGLHCPAWMTRAQCEQLKAHLGRGAAALVVRSESAAEQDASSRALLRQVRHIVWTYDFSQSFAAHPAPDGE